MQFKYLLSYLVFCFVLLAFQDSANAQRIAQNRNGEQIIIFPDGSWKKFDKKNPQHKAIQKNYEKQLEEKEINITEKGLSETRGEKRLRLAKEKVSQAEDDLELAKERWNEAKFKRMELEEELNELMDNEEVKSHEISFVENKIKGAKGIESQAKKHVKMAKKELKLTKKELYAVAPESKQKAPKSTKRAKNKKYASKQTPPLTPEQAKAKQLAKESTLTAETKKFAKYDINKDVMYNPPKSQCGFLFDGVDEFLGKRRKDVNLGTFFAFTDDEMRRYLGNKEYLVCEGNLTQIEGGILLLNLHYSIATRDAIRTFGGLSKGSLLTVKFISGSKIKLVNTKDVTGAYDPLTERHTFVAQYIINSGQEKLLKKEEVDKVRVIWKTGYEDYEVYDVDFIKDQLDCLNRK